jgi:hypothetical protein
MNKRNKRKRSNWQAGDCCLTPVILATQEAEIRKNMGVKLAPDKQFFYYYSFIHMCVHCLGHFSP